MKTWLQENLYKKKMQKLSHTHLHIHSTSESLRYVRVRKLRQFMMAVNVLQQ